MELTAHSLRSLQRSAEALALVRQVSPAFQDRSDMLYVEAILCLDVGELDSAEELFQRCLTLPDNGGQGGASQSMTRTWAPAYHLGILREVLGLRDEASECYRRVLCWMPEHKPTLKALERLSATPAKP